MKLMLIAAVGSMMLSAAASALASEPTDMDGAKTPAGQVVAVYLAKEWGPNKDRAGADKLVSPHMIEHGYLGMMGTNAPPPNAAPPAEAKAGGPSPVITPLKIIAQGDLVFVQGVGKVGTKGNGDLMWILYRVQGGLITEHWDTHNPIPSDQAGKQW